MPFQIPNSVANQDLIKQLCIKQVTWQSAETDLREIRTAVFIQEQSVTPEFEWDDIDANAVHLLTTYDNEPIGCLRVIDYAKIGRMAVLSSWRGLGVGKMLLNEAIQICRTYGSKQIDLSAQKHAIHFYQQAGFEIISEEYTDVQIPHVNMRLIFDVPHN